MKKTLLKDIADELGVSISQVSRALNQCENVAPELRRKAIRLAKKKGYRNMSWKHRKKIAVLINSFSDFNIHLLNEIRNEVKTIGCDIVIIPMESINMLSDQIFDGAFIISHNAAEFQWNERFKIPLVIINNYGEPLDNIKAVLPDADQEVRIAMEHLIALGHKKIARIRFKTSSSNPKELKRGVNEFYRIASEHRLRKHVSNLCVKDFNAEIEAVLELAGQGYTAFLVVINDWAPILLQALIKAGYRIPEDISLITYESNFSDCQTPPLTTLEYNYKGIIKMAFSQLFSEMECQKNQSESSQVLIPCKMNIRGSTAPVPD